MKALSSSDRVPKSSGISAQIIPGTSAQILRNTQSCSSAFIRVTEGPGWQPWVLTFFARRCRLRRSGHHREFCSTTAHRPRPRPGRQIASDPDGRLQTSKDRRRFAFERAGELWLSDVMHAVPVEIDGRRKRKTYLLALLDDATRVVTYAQFAFAENTAAFLPVLEQAIRRRGLPSRFSRTRAPIKGSESRPVAP